MEEEDDYERLEGVGIMGNMVAGAFAGTAEHIVMYPIDSVKTRMQALKCEKKLAGGIFSSVRAMMREEGGAMRPLRGATVVIGGSFPAHALYFAGYEQIKKAYFNSRKFKSLPDGVGHSAAGAVATILHDAIMTPAEAVKQRMQMCCSKHTRWTLCAKQIYREEGSRAFFRAYTTQLSMNLPFQMCQFAVYEKTKKILNPEGKYDPKSHVISGLVAGATASAITNPLDVCKTLLNTQEPLLLKELKISRIDGGLNAVQTVIKVAGYRGFLKGLSARVLFQAPSSAICWFTYESLKHLISLQHNIEEKYETLADIRPSIADIRPTATTSGSTASGDKAKPGGDKLWETITDLPRPIRALETWGEQQPNSALKYSESKFAPSIRSE